MLVNNIKEILANNKHIGIFISGGFDSALLLYLVKVFQQDNKISLFTVDRFNLSIKYSKVVCDWINEKFNDNLTVNIVGNPKTLPDLQVRSGFKDAFNYDVNIILLGDTTNPQEITGGYFRQLSQNPKIIQPFFSVTKDKLVELAKEYNVLELLNITHSCGENTDQECGVCWNCKEKIWAMNKILYTY